MDRYPQSRDSDIELQLLYWETFDDVSTSHVSKDNYRQLTKLTSITRARALIQNQLRLFRSSADVRQLRGARAAEHRALAAPETPQLPRYEVVLDESGITDDYLVIGSVWHLDPFSILKMTTTATVLIGKLKSQRLGKEFHVKDLNRDKLDIYLQFVDFLGHGTTAVDFRFITLRREGIADTQRALIVMTYELLKRGIDQLHSLGRAPLPRLLRVIKDKDKEGSDRLFLNELRDLLEKSPLVTSGALTLGDFNAIASHELWSLQAADIVAACARRASAVNFDMSKLSGSTSPKDILAERFLGAIGINGRSGIGEVSVGDRLAHYKL